MALLGFICRIDALRCAEKQPAQCMPYGVKDLTAAEYASV